VGRKSNYDKLPFTPVGPSSSCCEVGWTSIAERLGGLRTRRRCVLVVECYPGVDVDGVRRALTEGLRPVLVVDARQAFKDPAEVERMCAPYLGDDPVFGRMNRLTMADFLEPGRRAVLRGRVDAAREGPTPASGRPGCTSAASSWTGARPTASSARSSTASTGCSTRTIRGRPG
jgi:hypothetical protein